LEQRNIPIRAIRVIRDQIFPAVLCKGSAGVVAPRQNECLPRFAAAIRDLADWYERAAERDATRDPIKDQVLTRFGVCI